MALIIGARLGVYEVIAPIGEGGMGLVYRGRDTKLNRDVALKVLPESFAHDSDRLARFTREARTLASLNHPHIAIIHGLEDAGDVHALVMELVEGEDLSQRIARGPIPLHEARPIATQIAEALEAAHEHGIVHRDLKPANIKVREDGEVKVLDFGLAKLTSADGSGPQASAELSRSPTVTSPAMMTGVGVILGTAAYMSPEQARGKTVDKRADIWAFGVVLFEMLTGQRPFTGETISDTLASVLKTAPNWSALPAGTPDAMRRLLRRCLEKDPKQRLQAIGEARIVLSDPVEEVRAPVAGTSRSLAGLLPWALAGTFLLTTAVSLLYIPETRPPPASVRFLVSAPENSAFRPFQLSPDGRRLAFVVSAGGQTRLWIRSLDSVTATPLAGTDGATYPFWSTDSTRIGFFAQRKLKTIAAGGGVALSICDAADGRGGTWNADGVILFAPDSSGGLYRVADIGGTPVPVTTVMPGSNDSDRFPQFLPGGRRFLFLRNYSSNDDSGVYVGTLSGAPFARLLPDETNAEYVPGPGHDGFLLFRRDNSLMAQPFDPDRLATTGGVVPLAERVNADANVGHGAFAASRDGTLAYLSGVRGGNRQLVWLDRSGGRLEVVSKPDEVSTWALSPDGKMVAFSIGNFSEGVADLWLQRVDSGTPSRLTFGSARNMFPVWSPDASQIAFEFLPPGALDYQVRRFQVAGAGSSEVLLQGAFSGIGVSDWSRDGRLIAFSNRSAQTRDDLWLLSTDGNRKAVPYLQTPANERDGRFSPDGEWLAYQSDESGRYEVYVQHVPRNGSKSQISFAGGSGPQWSRNGKELFYLEGGQRLMSVPVTLGTRFAFGQGRAVFDHVPFYSDPGSGSAFQPSGDGQRFLALLQADGGSPAPSITIVTNWQSTLKK